MKIRTCRGQIALSNIYDICTLAIPNHISTISMRIPSMVKTRWYILKLSSGNENTDVSGADKSLKNLWNLPINTPKLNFNNINAHTKFGENPLTYTQVIVRKRLIVLGLTIRQPLWVILCRLPQIGRRAAEEIVEDMKERDGGKEENEWKWKNRRNINIPSTLAYCKNNRPFPAVSQSQLAARRRKIYDIFASPKYPPRKRKYGGREGRTYDRPTDNQRDTIIPSHYRMVG